MDEVVFLFMMTNELLPITTVLLLAEARLPVGREETEEVGIMLVVGGFGAHLNIPHNQLRIPELIDPLLPKGCPWQKGDYSC